MAFDLMVTNCLALKITEMFKTQTARKRRSTGGWVLKPSLNDNQYINNPLLMSGREKEG